MSIEEWGDMPEDDEGEWVDGHLEEEELTDMFHEVAVAWLIQHLSNWLGSDGVAVGSEAKYRVRADRGRKSDIAVFLPGGKRPPRRGLVRVPPEIMVEVLSPRPRDGRRDRIEKTQEYASFRVRWYWLVDPQLQTLEVLELGADGTYRIALAAGAGTVAVPGCGGLALDLDDLWKQADLLGPEEPEEG
jgi:Uma2 family endonuclease